MKKSRNLLMIFLFAVVMVVFLSPQPAQAASEYRATVRFQDYIQDYYDYGLSTCKAGYVTAKFHHWWYDDDTYSFARNTDLTMTADWDVTLTASASSNYRTYMYFVNGVPAWGDQYSFEAKKFNGGTVDFNFIPKNHRGVYVYNAPGGTASASAKSGELGTEITLTPRPDSGYGFSEWKVMRGAATIQDDKFSLLMDTAIYPFFKPLNQCELTLDAQGGTVSSAKVKLNAEGKPTSLPTPTYTGHAFQGWYDAPSGGNMVTTNTVFDRETTIYARWNTGLFANPSVLNLGTFVEGYDYQTLPFKTISVRNAYDVPVKINLENTANLSYSHSLESIPSNSGLSVEFRPGKNLAPGTYTQVVNICNNINADKISVTVVFVIKPAYEVQFYDINLAAPHVTLKVGPTGLLPYLPSGYDKDGWIFDGWWTTPSTGGERVSADMTFSKNTIVYGRWTEGLSADKSELNFGAVVEGYESVPARTVEITNVTGEQLTSALIVRNDLGDIFRVSKIEEDPEPNGKSVFQIQPAEELPPGVYATTVEIVYRNDQDGNVTIPIKVKFTVLGKAEKARLDDDLGRNVNTADAATVYFGKDHEDKAFAWRVIGYMDVGKSVKLVQGENTKSYSADKLTLLAAENMGEAKKFADNNRNYYADSALKTAIEAIAKTLTAREKAAVTERPLFPGDYNGADTDCVAGDPVKAALMWPLSSREAKETDETLRRTTSDPVEVNWAMYYWWLRSPGSGEKVAHVKANGTLNATGESGNQQYGVRPAVNIDPGYILFASAAENGKPGDNGLTAIAENTANEWKLTLRDKDRKFTASRTGTETVAPGDTVTLSYENARVYHATTAPNEYISGLLLDESGKTAYYGKLLRPEAAAGTFEVKLPAELKNGVYTLQVFNEECNGDYETDYAGAFSNIPLTVKKADPVTVTGIELDSKNAKKIYAKGEALNVTGLTLTVSKSDGSKEQVDVTAAMVAGFDGDKVGEQTLTVTYAGFTATYKVEVQADPGPVTVTGIELDSKNAKKIYAKGEALNVTGLTLTVSKSDGSKEQVAVTAAMVAGFDGDKVGEQTLTVTYAGFTDTYKVEVKAKSDPTTFTLTYITNGGDAIKATTHESGVTVELTVVPTRKGFTFTGWYSDAALTKKISSVKIDGDKAVYAGWEEAKHDCPSAKFTDVNKDPNHWSHAGIDYVVKNNLMKGTSETTFAPNAPTNRAMIVTILYRLEGEPKVSGNIPFKDVPAGKWFSNAILWANQENIVNGYNKTTFGPNDNIKREQMATILYRYSTLKKIDTTKRADLSGFKDQSKISKYAVAAMQWAVAENYINGTGNNNLSPAGNATRAQIATILMRFRENTK